MKGLYGILTGKQTPVLGYAQRNAKFRDEKVQKETERYLVHFDGVLLAHARPAADDERFLLLTGLYERYGTSMTAHLKGQYNLVIWDKQRRKALVTSDLLSRRPMYYSVRENKLFYASSYDDLLELLSAETKERPVIDEEAVRSMAHNGALAGVHTYLRDVHYLDAYQALCYDLDTGAVKVEEIRPEACQPVQSMEEAVRQFDTLFANAVKAQFDKNAEYGYEHFMALSGGMDSRACLLKAVACGYQDGITCVNYSQTDSIDNTVSRQLAYDNRLDYLFYPMDAAVFMTRLDEAMRCNECQQSCIGSTGARTMARLLDKTRMGIMHVGLCGGELMGDLISCHAGSRLQSLLLRLGMNGEAQYTFNRRDYLDNLRACQNFSQMFLEECETVSPFMDEDVVRFVNSLDPKLLYRRRLYREWMIQCVPNDYPTTYFCGPVGISPVGEIMAKIADRVIRRVAGSSRRDMNPIAQWLKIHPQLSKACDDAYADGMEKLRKADIPADVAAVLSSAWEMGAEQKLYTLTAVTALVNITRRFQ